MKGNRDTIKNAECHHFCQFKASRHRKSEIAMICTIALVPTVLLHPVKSVFRNICSGCPDLNTGDFLLFDDRNLRICKQKSMTFSLKNNWVRKNLVNSTEKKIKKWLSGRHDRRNESQSKIL